MQSAKSYFNLTLYRKHLTRYWPIWVVYTIMWLFQMPVYLILSTGTGYGSMSGQAAMFADRTVLHLVTNQGVITAAFFGLITAMAVWSYLYNNRASGLIHALPIRREGLFLTGFLSGVTFFVVPNAVIFLLTLLAEMTAGVVNVGNLALWFAVQTMLCVFFFCFATLCGFVTGHILVLPAFFIIFNFLAMGLLMLVENVLSTSVYGFTSLTGAWDVARALSPLSRLVTDLSISYIRASDGTILGTRLDGVPMLAIYFAAGLAAAVLALLFYRRHHAEQAGEVVTARWLRPVFKYGVSVCGALAFGTVLYEMLRQPLGGNTWGLLAVLLLCGFLSYLAAEMLLQKSLRVLGRSWKGCVIFLAVLCALYGTMELDLTGYEKRVPNLSDVERVTVSGLGGRPYGSARGALELTDPALIERVVSLHRSTAQNKQAVENATRTYQNEGRYSDDEGIERFSRTRFYLTYTLENGQVMARAYTIPVTAELLSDPGSPAALLQDFMNNRENIADDYFPKGVTADDFIDGTVTFYRVSDMGDVYMDDVSLTGAQAGALYEAAMRDFEAGKLGRRYLLADEEYRNKVYENEIMLTCYGAFSDWTIEIPKTPSSKDSVRVSFHPQTDSANLIAALGDLGILSDENRLMTAAGLWRDTRKR